MNLLSISQLNRYVKSVLEEDSKLNDLYLRGEVSNFTNHTRSGHFYFTLKDDEASVRAVMFRVHASQLRFMPENGMSVISRVSVGLYEREGSFQIYVTDLMPDGEGAVAVAIRQRKERLEKLGVFDVARKRRIPDYPQTIGVITSESGAAIGDIIKVLGRRWPVCKMLFCPTLVQGESAPQGLINALKALDSICDVIIIGRGGGSAEDLWAFQSEELALAIFNSKTPVISAVGHESDTTICDLAADLCAPTPSAAAELAVPDVEQELKLLAHYESLLSYCAKNMICRVCEQFNLLANCKLLKNPEYFIKKKQERLDFIAKALYNIQYSRLKELEKQLEVQAGFLDTLSPLRVIARGYSAVFVDGRPVVSVAQLDIADEVCVQMNDGELIAKIEEIKGYSDDESKL